MANFYFEVIEGTIIRGPIARERLTAKAVSIGAGTTDAELLALGWFPQVKVGDDAYDPATEVKTGPVHSVEADQVTSTWTIRAKTQQEIDDEKDAIAQAIADDLLLQAAVRAIAQVQQEKGAHIVNADLATVRQRAITWLLGQV